MNAKAEEAKDRFLKRLHDGHFELSRAPNLGKNYTPIDEALDTQAVEAFCTSELIEAVKHMR